MSQQRTPANIWEDDKDSGVSTTNLAFVEEAGGDVVLAEGRAGTHKIEYQQSTGDWVLVEQ